MNERSNMKVDLFRKTGALVDEYSKTGPKWAELILIHLCLNLVVHLGPEATVKHLRQAGRYSITDLRWHGVGQAEVSQELLHA